METVASILFAICEVLLRMTQPIRYFILRLDVLAPVMLQLLGVTATCALELGVDIGELDVTLHLGFPGACMLYALIPVVRIGA